MELGAVEGPEMEFTFESHIVSMQLPAAVPGWKIIQPMPKLQVYRCFGPLVHTHAGLYELSVQILIACMHCCVFLIAASYGVELPASTCADSKCLPSKSCRKNSCTLD